MKAVLKKIFLFLAATALLLYISAGTAYLTYSLYLKGSPLFYASEALEIAGAVSKPMRGETGSILLIGPLRLSFFK